MIKFAPKGHKYSYEWLKQQLFNNNRNGTDIAKELGVSPTAIYDACKRHGLKLRNQSDSQRVKFGYKELNDVEWLNAKYNEDGLTTYEISNILGCNEESVRKNMKRMGISRRSKGTRYVVDKVRSREWLYNQYVTLNKTQEQIAEELDCGSTVICKWVRMHKIHKDTRWSHNDWKESKGQRNSLEYNRWRKKVYAKDDFICTNCGSNKRLQAHHIKPFAHYKHLRYEVTNGITLCINCHRRIHSRRPTAITKIG